VNEAILDLRPGGGQGPTEHPHLRAERAPGKTTFLNMLSESIPHNERIVTIEDSAELQLRQPHVVRLETRPPNIEGGRVRWVSASS
jgi:type IV secretory pathway ATPase VirB11/archaellum biosynthesis ATPase